MSTFVSFRRFLFVFVCSMCRFFFLFLFFCFLFVCLFVGWLLLVCFVFLSGTVVFKMFFYVNIKSLVLSLLEIMTMKYEVCQDDLITLLIVTSCV